MNGLSLFSGIGGIDVALSEYVRSIAYCEIDPYCQKVLLSRMADESLNNSPIWDDITTVQGGQFRGLVDIIFGGFPCQDISIAGNGKGLAGERSGLFYEIVRLCREIKPRFLFLENVPAITTRGGAEVGRSIAAMGYDCRWCIISAASVGAMHRRERWFLLAHSNSESGTRLQSRTKKGQPKLRMCNESKAWDAWPENESTLLGVDHGIPFRLDRTKSLGNAVVPIQCKKAFQILMGIYE